MGVIATLLDGLTAVGCVLAGIMLFFSLTSLANPMGMAAMAIFALALAVIPYCLAGAFHRTHGRTKNG